MVNSQAVGGSGCASRACAGCGGRISDRFLLFSMERYWHTRCLKCSCCQAQLGDIGTTCYSKGGMILCRSDYIRLFGHAGACSACGQSIPPSEMVMRAQGNVYHLKCFSCATCRNRLVPGDRFHYVNGTIFCEHDRPSAPLLGAHLQGNPVLPDQKFAETQFSSSSPSSSSSSSSPSSSSSSSLRPAASHGSPDLPCMHFSCTDVLKDHTSAKSLLRPSTGTPPSFLFFYQTQDSSCPQVFLANGLYRIS